MCLLVLAWMKHPRYRLVVAANRDEFHDRAAAPLAWWTESPMLAGRDLQAGGTWMGVARNGRFAALTNFRDPGAINRPGTPSRGTLVPRFISGGDEPADFFESLARSASEFAGFNLIAAGPRSLHYYSNRADRVPRELAPGIYGLSNHELDARWPKLARTRDRLTAEIVRGGGLEPSTLFDLLADREPADELPPPDTGLPADLWRAASAPFVLHPRYGTRCSTVLLAGHDGQVATIERRFDAAGRMTGATRIEFAGDEPRR